VSEEPQRQAQAAEIRFQRLLDAAPDGILIVDGQGRIQVANPQVEAIFGYRQDELLGQPIEVLVPERYRPRHTQARSDYSHAPRTRPMGLGMDLTGRRKDGSEVPVEISLSPMPLDGVTQVVAIVRDVTEHKHAEQALRRQAAELARSNADLEQFAMVASHDLQEPLRMVAAYCELLRRRYAGKLDAEADQYIGFAVEGAKRMQRLINGVLAYSRVGARARPFELVDLNAVITTAKAAVAAAIEQSGAQITAAPLPTIMGREEELVLLFQHLFSNSLKFRGQQRPEVHVGAEARGGEWLFRVRDNGIGFEPEYRERIFHMFQRLHPRGTYPGEGLGLAVCRKIVEHHGGRIWAESALGRGATFCFSLPQSQEARHGTEGN